MNGAQPAAPNAAAAQAAAAEATANNAAEPDAGEAKRRWSDAAWAGALLAVAPQSLGGAVLRAGAGPVRDRWLRDFQHLLPAAMRQRRMPVGIADERLLGGLDLAATLRLGKPVAQRGLLAESDGGVVTLPMAERLSAGTAARLCAALDSGAVGFERDGLSTRWDARVGVLALDEAAPDDEPLSAALADRLAFRLDLRELGLRDCGEAAADADEITAARALLPRVTLADDTLQALCGTARQLGVDSPRASLLALRAARAAAALAGRATVNDDDAILAARLVLGPRATRLPSPPVEPEAETSDEAPAPPEPDGGDPEPQPPAPPDASETPPEPPPETPDKQPEETPADKLEDRMVEATTAALPAGLLAALMGGAGGTQSGRVGALTKSPRSGRPVGTRRGEPRGGARLNLIETLRAAAPWQRIRAAAAAGQPSPAAAPAARGRAGAAATVQRAERIHIQADDLRVSRLQQRAATATIFVIDASGSSALHRLAEAKGAINLLLADCYVRRDQVAVIAFRGRGAELLLPPTRSLVRAKRSLAGLPGGGATPLAAGLEAALRLSEQVRRAGATPIVVLLTDGRGNIARDGTPGRARAEADALAMARRLRAARLTTLVVDTSPQPAPAAQRLALELRAHYRALPYAGAAALSAAVKTLPGSAR